MIVPEEVEATTISQTRLFDVDDVIILADLRAWARSLVEPSEDVELVLTELVGNAKQHGRSGVIIVELWAGPTHVAISVSNEIALTPASITQAEIMPDSSNERGRGLLIAAAFSTSLHVEQRNNRLRVTATVARR